MIADLKPYREYSESGSPWLGKFPAHWQLHRLGSVLRERGESNEARQIDQVLSVMKDIGVIRYEDKGRVGNKKSEDTARYKVVRPDDIVVNCMNVIIGSVGLSCYTGCLSPVYYVLTRRIETDNPRYLNAVFQTKPFQLSLVRIGNGILSHRMRIPMDLLKCEPFPVPPPDEQAAIVRFIDYATRRIDRTIRAKRKVIALLNEQKQSIIHRAVTRGLDPNVPLKSSGIPWLGDIPEHWETPLLGRCITRIEQGWSPVAAEGEFEEDQWAVLTLSSVKRGVFNPTAIKPVSKTANIPRSIEVVNGDVLLTRSNTRDRVGDVCIVEGIRPRTILCDLIYRLSIQEKLLESRFLVYQLLSPLGRGQIERDARGSSGTMPKIAQGHIKSWRVLLPPVEEQRKITSNINTETAQFNEVIHRTEREIDLFREYRTRLIADVVTGKLDVREVAKKLPDESAESGIIDDDEILVGDEEMEESLNATGGGDE
ncbi:MAG TPA: restriction endonuclease subunit S [Euryarchaeota archaeon]|nr:restriction endonuclease subunit S [Euryarchaeota archaeon]